MIRAGFAQFAPEFGHVGRNLEHMAELINGSQADLIVFPELAATGYEFEDAAEVALHAERFADGPTAEFLTSHSARLKITLIAGYPERTGERLYNSCMLATPGGQLFNYRKLHLFSRENDLFSPGDAVPPVIDTPAGRIGLMICFDWFFPEVARVLALNGAQIIAHPSNLVMGYCQRSMYARSVENGVFTITANRTGDESRAGRALKFTGSSQVLDTRGNLLVSATPDETAVRIAEIDPLAADNKALNPYNDLMKSRRPEFYRDLAKEP
jgi:5-aminopentanamidase